MLIRVDPASSVGLADQIAAQVRAALATGALSAGDRLPAARELAGGLDVNMHTVLRAYAALQAEGLIELRRGRGAVVRRDAQPQLAELHQRIKELVEAGERFGLSRAELADKVRKGTR